MYVEANYGRPDVLILDWQGRGNMAFSMDYVETNALFQRNFTSDSL